MCDIRPVSARFGFVLCRVPEAGSLPDDVRVAQHLTENDNGR